jgi:hypothetical protein
VTSTTVEPARLDIARCASGGIILSSVATRYQLGFDFQAGSLTAPSSASTPHGTFYALYHYLVRRFDPFHLWLLMATAAFVAAAVIAALSGISMPVCLVIVMLAPAVTVVGYELRGYRHQAAALVDEEAT